MSQEISVYVVTRLLVGRPRFDSHLRQRFFSSPSHSDRFWGPPSLLYKGYQWFFHRG